MTHPPPDNGPFASREQAEAVFAGFRQAAASGRTGPPGEQLFFTARQWKAEALADTIELWAGLEAYDREVITKLAGLLDAVEIGVVASWFYRAARDEYDPVRYIVT